MGQVVALLNEDMGSPRSFREALGDVAAWTKPCPGRPSPSEDSALIFTDEAGIILAVADGAGGMPDGDRASRVSIEALRAHLAPRESSHRAAILDGFEAANKAVRALGTGAGTTLSVVELVRTNTGVTMRSYHAGDSSVLVTGGRGRIKFNTLAHSPVGYGVEAGLIEPNAALHHRDLNLVSNLLGSSDMRIDVASPIDLAPRDTVVVGTDGLFDNLRGDEISECVRRGPIGECAVHMAALTTNRMLVQKDGAPSKPDDTAFLLFRPRERASR